MNDKVRVGCPAENCGIVFEPPAGWLGKNIYCPACGIRMTARPLDVEAQIRERADLRGGRAGQRRRLPLVVVVDNVRSLWNVGSIFRSADACAVQRLILTGITGHPPREEISKTALGAERVVDWDYRGETGPALQEMRQAGYTVVALETGADAVDIDRFEWPERTCLVVGNEVAGVGPQHLDAADLHVAIPMFGIKQSFNVAVAFGIAAHRASSVLARRAALAAGHR